jgi:hypothetical protein
MPQFYAYLWLREDRTPHTLEAKEKMRAASLGHTHSSEQKVKIAAGVRQTRLRKFLKLVAWG